MWSHFDPHDKQNLSCSAKLLHMNFFAPRTMSAASVTNVMYACTRHIMQHAQKRISPNIFFFKIKIDADTLASFMLAPLCVSWVHRGIYWADHTHSNLIGVAQAKGIPCNNVILGGEGGKGHCHHIADSNVNPSQWRWGVGWGVVLWLHNTHPTPTISTPPTLTRNCYVHYKV